MYIRAGDYVYTWAGLCIYVRKRGWARVEEGGGGGEESEKVTK